MLSDPRSGDYLLVSEIRTTVPDADEISDWLVENMAEALEIDAGDVAGDRPFSEFGLDSTDALRLTAELGMWLQLEIEPTIAWYHPTIDELAEHLASEVAR